MPLEKSLQQKNVLPSINAETGCSIKFDLKLVHVRTGLTDNLDQTI